MPRYTTVLLDLDGTLIDSIRLILDSYHHTFAQHGLPPQTDDHFLRGIGTPLRAQLAGWAADEAAMDAMIATYRAFNFANHDARVRPYPGVVAALRALRAAGVRLGVVTSKARYGTELGLRAAGIEDAFETLVCADDVTNPKPHREPVDRAMAALAADPRATIFVGDSIHDLHAGRAAGVRTGAALWGPFERDDLIPGEPDHWLTSIDDLVTLALA